jgi:hypothetical protein
MVAEPVVMAAGSDSCDHEDEDVEPVGHTTPPPEMV